MSDFPVTPSVEPAETAPVEAAGGPVVFLTVWPDDDWASLRFRIARAPAPRVALEVPPDHPGPDPVLLRRLQRFAEGRGKALALIAPHREWRAMAREAGWAAFPTRAAALRHPWPAEAESEEAAAPPGLTPTLQAWAAARRRPRPAWARGIGLALGGLGLLAMGLLAAFLVPSAEVTLSPQGVPLAITQTVVADPRLAARDLTRWAIPAYPVEVRVEGQAEAPATGRQEKPAGYAEGRVILVNQLNRPVEVPAGTIVRAASGNLAVRFVISPSVTVPAGFGATAEARVRALEPGPAGNVGPNQINRVEGPLAFALRVSNPEPLTGGRLETVPVVTTADRDRVREALLDRLRQQGYAQMLAGLDPQDCVLSSTLTVSVIRESYDRLVGEPAERLRAEILARVVGYKVLRSDLGALALVALSRSAPPGHELSAEGFSFTDCERLQARVFREETGALPIELPLEAHGQAIPRLPTDEIRRALRGRTPGAALQRLQALPLARPPEIRQQPTWWPWLPFLESRIRVRIQP